MYIGNEPALAYTSFAVQHFTTSATTSYTLDHSVTNENEIRLVINNVVQQPGSSYAYTASGTALTLSAATTSSDTMYCVFLGKAVQTVTPANNSVTGDMLVKPFTYDDASNGSVTGISVNNDYPTTSTASAGTGSGIRFGVNDGSFTSAFGDARGSEILSVTQQSNGRTRDIVFKTDNGGTLGEKIRILASGGITFNGDTASANALNDYEEGSFTPSLDIETGSNISVSTIQGYYRKIGNLVAFTIFCVWDKTAGSANMKFTGLPFTCSNQTNLSSQAVNWLQGAYTDQGAFFGGRVFGSSTDVYFVDSKHGSFNSNFDTNNAGRIANTTGIRTYVNGTYFTT